MSLAVIQMATGAEVARNLAQARQLLEQAAEAGARLAVLPENFAAMGRNDLPSLGRAEAMGEGPILPWLKQAARDLGLWIVAGTLPLPPDDCPQGKPNACSLLIDEQGQRVARYDKLHLFDADVADSRGRYRESDDYAAGSQVVVADTPLGRLGMSVCYDLRFAELYAALRAAGGIDQRALGVYRGDRRGALDRADSRAAIETQCYVPAAAQGGEHPVVASPMGIRLSLTHGAGCCASSRAVRRLCLPSETQSSRPLSANACRCNVTADFPYRARARNLGVDMSELLLPVTERLLTPEARDSTICPVCWVSSPAPAWMPRTCISVTVSESRVLEDGIVKEGGFHLEQGVGVRALSGRRPALPTAMRSLPMPCARPRRPPAPSPVAGSRGRSRCSAGRPSRRCIIRTIRWMA